MQVVKMKQKGFSLEHEQEIFALQQAAEKSKLFLHFFILCPIESLSLPTKSLL